MFKMLIVDDEPVTRQGIRNSVNWELMDIEIVGEASNGLEAMLLIHDLNPDIVICDIRMPKLDGISLINEIQPSHPNLQVLFLSGYSDKEYLKNAIRLEAVDYIFKPFQLHELVYAIEKAKKNCLKKRQSSSNQNADAALELLHYNNENSSSPVYSELPIDLSASIITIIIRLNSARLNDGEEHGESEFSGKFAANRFYSKINNAAANVFGSRFVMSAVNSCFVIHANSGGLVFTAETFEPFFSAMGDKGNAVTLGVGGVVSSAELILSSYKQALEASKASFLVGCGSSVFFNELNSRCESFVSPELNEFYDDISNSRFSAAISWLNCCIDRMRRCRTRDIPMIKDVLASVIFWLNERISQKENEDIENGREYVTEIVNNAADISEIQEYMLRQIAQYVDEISNLDNKGRILLEAEQYVVQNYDKELTIKAIAAQVYITPNYLCYIYKKKTGKTLNQFILDVKMDKAKKLICETGMQLGSIAEALGYANQNYFTRTFTKYFGVSPRTYRNNRG